MDNAYDLEFKFSLWHRILMLCGVPIHMHVQTEPDASITISVVVKGHNPKTPWRCTKTLPIWTKPMEANNS